MTMNAQPSSPAPLRAMVPMRTRRQAKLERKRAAASSGAMTPSPSATGGGKRSSQAGRAIPDVSLWQQAGRLGGKLTPTDVSNIIRAADSGVLYPLMDLANECRQKDTHLSAVLTVAEESIAGLKWKLTLPEDARKKDKTAAKWIEKVLRALPQLRKLIAYLAGAPYYGFDVNEILWRKSDEGKMVPADFCHLSHRRFGFDPNTGAFVYRDSWMPQQGIDFRAEYPNKFIVSQPRANGDAPQREGLCRPLVWMTQFRVWSFADWLRTAELSWKPWRIGTYKKDRADTEDENALEHILQKLSTSGWAAKPDSMDIAIEWPGGNQSSKATHAELVNILAQEMSKCILGQTETTQSSGSSGYAQAKVHDEVRRDIRESRAMQIAADLTRDLITPMIMLNFGPDIAIPMFEFITQDPIDLTAFADAVQKLTAARLKIPTKWVRDEAGIPEPKDDEETIGGEPEPDPNDPNDDPNGDDDKDPEDDKDPKAKPADSDDSKPGAEEKPAAAKPKPKAKAKPKKAA